MVCEALAADRDDMVAKGLSWALRDLSKRDRASVWNFIEIHDSVLPALVKREVKNKLTTGVKNPRRGVSKPGKKRFGIRIGRGK